MSEQCSISSLTSKDDKTSGHAGGPIANVKIKLKDIPDFNFKSANNPHQGEVLIWSPSVMPGYFRNEDLSYFAFDGEWL